MGFCLQNYCQTLLFISFLQLSSHHLKISDSWFSGSNAHYNYHSTLFIEDFFTQTHDCNPLQRECILRNWNYMEIIQSFPNSKKDILNACTVISWEHFLFLFYLHLLKFDLFYFNLNFYAILRAWLLVPMMDIHVYKQDPLCCFFWVMMRLKWTGSCL